MKTIIIISVVVLASIGWWAWECNNAPEGYEDETGFHYGSKK